MNKIFLKNKKRLTHLIHSARLNEMTLNEYIIILKRRHESKKLHKKTKKFGVMYDWENAEFDKELGWLYVQEFICAPTKEAGFISIYTNLYL